MDDLSVLLIQFAKWPEVGRVKTRLAPLLGEEGAMQAHIRLTRQVLRNLVATGLSTELWWDRPLQPLPESAVPILEDLATAGVAQRYQAGSDLGARMTSALLAGLAGYDKVLIVGSDCPSVDPEYVRAATRALESSDLVLGPSDDGGYVLIGARTAREGMLADVDWGTAKALAQTCHRLQEQGFSYRLLEPRWDVDEPGDWQRFLHQFPG